MKLHIFQDVMACFRIELEQFTIKHICVIPMRIEGNGGRYWAITDARTYDEAMTELNSSEMTIWVPRRCAAELDGKVMVRGRRGFETEILTDALRPHATLFVAKDGADSRGLVV